MGSIDHARDELYNSAVELTTRRRAGKFMSTDHATCLCTGDTNAVCEQDNAEQISQNSVPLSKNAIKRLKKQEKWEANKEVRKAKRKERRLARRRNKSADRPPINHDNDRRTDCHSVSTNPHESDNCVRRPSGIRIIIDCSFNDKMSDKEIISLSSQLVRCYSDNRRAAQYMDLAITSFGGDLESRMEGALHGQYRSWKDVTVDGKDVMAYAAQTAIPLTSMVYLTADAEELLKTLDPGTTYILGGIIDRNRYKNLCLDKAKGLSMRAARLPISEYIRLSTRHVLTINQVLEIMLEWFHSRNWQQAFFKVIPKRKFRKQKEIQPVPVFEGLDEPIADDV